MITEEDLTNFLLIFEEGVFSEWKFYEDDDYEVAISILLTEERPAKNST